MKHVEEYTLKLAWSKVYTASQPQKLVRVALNVIGTINSNSKIETTLSLFKRWNVCMPENPNKTKQNREHHYVLQEEVQQQCAWKLEYK